MKRIILTLGILLQIVSSNAQQNWLKSIGSQLNEEILDATINQSGEIISVGYLSGNLNIGNSTLQSNGNSDVLIIKTDINGNVLWSTNAGGIGADRANSVVTDNNGNIYITGYFYNSANFDAITITGQDRDAFVAKLDANGNFLWAQSMGGQFGDTGYGIEVDNNGNVFCTGQYKGSASFGSVTLNSMINPNDNLPSYDIFISKLDANGNFLWTKDGKAKYDDRGLALAIDNSGNCYLTIEFSDTLTFQNQYNNDAFNAGMILSFDTNGNEIWNTIFTAGQVLMNDIKWKAGNLYLTGDFRGNLSVTDINNNNTTTFLSQYNYNIFTSKFDDNGDLIWLQSNFSSNELYAKQLALDVNNDVYVVGLFKCAFDEMNQLYGNSTFLSLGYRDVHYLKYNNNGEFQWNRQIGSNKDDYCSSIVINSVDFPILIGSNRNPINIPFGNNFNFSNDNISPYSNANCGAEIVEGITFNSNAGYYDIFYTSPFDVNRQPLDYYAHLSNYCSTDTVPPCIENCQDTLVFCYDPLGYDIFVNHFQNHEFPHYTKPIYNYQWSTGDNTEEINFTQSAYTFQNINVHIQREDDCWEWYDTTTVYINPVSSPPLITDSWGYNFNQPPLANSIDTCLVDTLFITAINNDTAFTTTTWSNGGYVNDSTIYVLSTGNYEVSSSNVYGCISFNQIYVSFDDFAIHDTLNPTIHFSNLDLELTDSIYTCHPFELATYVIDSNFVLPQGETPYKSTLWYIDGTYVDSIYHYYQDNPKGYIDGILIQNSGWHTVSAHLINECGDTVDYFFSRDFYIDFLPTPQLNLTTPLTNVCVDDTLMIYAQYNTDTVYWTGNNIINNYGDSIQVVIDDYYNPYGATVDTTANGLTCHAIDNIVITTPPQPEITMDPINGVVCPNDSVLLIAQSGIAWQWIGPDGSLLGTNQTQYTSITGFYHCIVTTSNGCVITSNFVEVKEYSSPFLVVDPSVFCIGDSTLIEVFSPSGTIINWLSPLSGNSNVINVDSAGTYYCETSFCNITKIDSVIVSESDPQVNLNITNDTLICPVNDIFIMATPGYVVYNWNSGQDVSTISTSDSGYYYVSVEDIYGCTAQSDTVYLGYLSNPQPPIISDTSVCLGSDISLVSNSSDTTNWYENNVLISNNSSITITNVDTTHTYYVTSSDSLCESAPTIINLSIYESSYPPQIIGDSVVCEGDIDLLLANQVDSNVVQHWITPNGQLTGNAIYFDPFTLQDSGVYYLYNQDNFCTSDTVSITLNVNPLPTVGLNFTGDSLMCPLDSVAIIANSNAEYIEWQNDGSADTVVWAYDTIPYSYYAELNGCVNYSDTVTISYYPYTQFSDTLYEQICQGDSVLFTVDSTLSVIWILYGDTLSYDNEFNTGALDYYQTYDLVIQDGNLCPIGWQAIVDVIPTDYVPEIFANDIYCVGDFIDIYGSIDSSVIFDEYIWVINGDTLQTFNDVVLPSSNDTIYNISLTYGLSGCYTQPVTYNLEVNNNPEVIFTTNDTTICANDILYITPTDSFSVITEIFANPNTNFDSLFVYTITDEFGCVMTDSINISYIDCALEAPNVFTPNGDNVNDIYYFKIINGEILHVTILNRWGSVIYETDENKWDGLNNNGRETTTGTYFYIVEYKLFDGTIKTKQGMVQLSR